MHTHRRGKAVRTALPVGSLRALLCIFAILLLPVFALAQPSTQATLLNPQPLVSISSGLTNPASGGGTASTYVLNGTCHGADAVRVDILLADGVTLDQAIPATAVTVKNGTWEALWEITAGTNGNRFVRVIPISKGVDVPAGFVDRTGAAVASQRVQVAVTNNAAAGALLYQSGSVGSGVFAVPSAGSFTHFIQLRGAGTTVGARVTDGIATTDYTFALAHVNDDQAANNAIPFSFATTQPGVALGLGSLGFTPITNPVGPVLAGVTYRRAVIYDSTRPATPTRTLTFLSGRRLRLTGTTSDANNGAGATLTPGGIASVEVLITPPGGTTERRVAHLAYGANPSDTVTYSLDFDYSGYGNGAYSFRVVATDYAGNKDANAVAMTPAETTANITNATPTLNTLTVVDPANAVVAPGSTIYGNANFKIRYNYNLTVPANQTITKVEILDGTNPLVTDNAPPAVNTNRDLTFDTTTAKEGTYTLHVRATDAQQNEYTLGSYTVTVDGTAPTATFTAPTNSPLVTAANAKVTAKFGDNLTANNNIEWRIYSASPVVPAAGGTFPVTNVLASSEVAPFARGDINNELITLAAGARTLFLLARDAAGNFSTVDQISLTVDSGLPTVSGLAVTPKNSGEPANVGTFVKGIVSITGTVADAAGGSAASALVWELFVDAVGGSPLATGTGPNITASLDTATLTQGARTVIIRVTDEAGNVNNTALAAARLGITVDRTAPVPTVTGPAGTNIGGSRVVSGTVSITGTVTDVGAVAGSSIISQVSIDGVAFGAEQTGASFSVSWNTTTATEGTHQITVTSRDTAGNVGTTAAAFAVVVNNTAPTAQVTTPVTNASVQIGTPVRGIVRALFPASTATFTFAEIGGTGRTSLVAGTLVSNTGGIATFSAAIPATYGLGGGVGSGATTDTSMNITLSGSDQLARTVTSPAVPVNLKATVPVQIQSLVVATGDTGQVAFYDAKNRDVIRGTVQVVGTVSFAGLSNWRVVLTRPDNTTVDLPYATKNADGTAAVVTANAARTGTLVQIATSGLAEGLYKIQIIALDSDNPANTTTSDFFSFEIDKSNPVVTVANAGTQFSTIDPTFIKAGAKPSFTGTITDATLNSYLLKDNGTTILTGTRSAGQELSGVVPTAGLTFADGAHSITLEATDIVGLQGVSPTPFVFNVDNTVPVTAFTKPTSGDANITVISGTLVARGTITVSGTFADTNRANVKVEYSGPSSGTLLNTVGGAGATFTTTFNTTTVADGDYTLTVTATDKAGNVATATRTIRVNNAVPIVVVVTPVSNALVQPGTPVQGLVTALYPASIATFTFTEAGGMGRTSIVAGTLVSNANGIATFSATVPASYGLGGGVGSGDTTGTSLNITLTGGDLLGRTAISPAVPVNLRTVQPVQIQNLIVATGDTGTVAFYDVKNRNTIRGVVQVFGGVKFAGLATWKVVLTRPDNSTVDLPYATKEANGSAKTISTTPPMAERINETLAQIDTTGFADGVYKVQIVAQDNAVPANTITSDFVSFEIDKTAPVVVVANAGTQFSTIDSTFVLAGQKPVFTANITDTTLNSYLLKDNGTTILTGTRSAGQELSGVVPTAGLTFADGAHSITLEATDIVGLQGVSPTPFVFNVDTVKPVVAFTKPIAGDTDVTTIVEGAVTTLIARGTITVSGTFADTNRANVKVEYSGPSSGTLLNTVGGAGATFTTTFNTTTVADGDYTLTVTATDKANNVSTATLKIRVDNTRPVAVLNPFRPVSTIDPTFIKLKEDVTVSGIVTDVNLKQFIIKDNGIAKLTTNRKDNGAIIGDFSLNLTGLADGRHTITVEATDVIGNTLASAVTQQFFVDHTDPVLAITTPSFTNPTLNGTNVKFKNGKFIGKRQVAIAGPLTEANLSNLTIRLIGETFSRTLLSTNTVAGGNFLTILNTQVNGVNVVPDGEYTITVTATDKAGNTASDSIALIVDNAGVSVELTSPRSNDPPQTNIAVRGRVTSRVFTDTNQDVTFALPPGTPETYTVYLFNSKTRDLAVLKTARGRDIAAQWIPAGSGTLIARNIPINPGPEILNRQPVQTVGPVAADTLLVRVTDLYGKTTSLFTVDGNRKVEAFQLGAAAAALATDSLELDNNTYVYEDGSAVPAVISPLRKPEKQKTVYTGNANGLEVQYSLVGATFLSLTDFLNNGQETITLDSLDRSAGGVGLPGTHPGSKPGALLRPYPTPGSRAREGRHFFTLIAADASLKARPQTLDVVVDTVAPTVNFTQDLQNLVYPLSSVIQVEFDILNSAAAGVVPSPIKRLLEGGQATNLPDLSMVITQADGKSVRTYNLSNAANTPNLDEDGQAVVIGDAFGKYKVRWQFRVVPTRFSAGQQYVLTVDGVKDVVGNAATKKTTNFRVGLN